MVFHSNPADHLAKLRRIAGRLEKQEMHADDMDDFCKTAWHLIELVERDTSSTREMRKRAQRLRADPDIMLCQHAANTEKHGKSRPEVAASVGLSAVKVAKGWGVGRFGKGGYGVGEQSVTFKFDDDTERNAFDFVAAVLRKWESVFGKGSPHDSA